MTGRLVWPVLGILIAEIRRIWRMEIPRCFIGARSRSLMIARDIGLFYRCGVGAAECAFLSVVPPLMARGDVTIAREVRTPFLLSFSEDSREHRACNGHVTFYTSIFVGMFSSL